MKKFLALLLIVAPLFTSAQGYVFNQNLRQGDRNLEVFELQKALNSLPGFVVATTGPGSPGFETNFYGSVTQNAVLRFQNIYAKEVLYPIGLSYGTGYFGTQTRLKLNSLLSGNTAQQSGTIAEEDLPPAEGKVLFVGTLLSTLAIEIIEEVFEELVQDVIAGIIVTEVVPTLTALEGVEGRPFGGKVQKRIKCDCSVGYQVFIGPPKGGTFHFIGPQKFRENNFPQVGQWSVGLYYPGGLCYKETGDSCKYLKTDGIIPGFVGSSK